MVDTQRLEGWQLDDMLHHFCLARAFEIESLLTYNVAIVRPNYLKPCQLTLKAMGRGKEPGAHHFVASDDEGARRIAIAIHGAQVLGQPRILELWLLFLLLFLFILLIVVVVVFVVARYLVVMLASFLLLIVVVCPPFAFVTTRVRPFVSGRRATRRRVLQRIDRLRPLGLRIGAGSRGRAVAVWVAPWLGRLWCHCGSLLGFILGSAAT